MSKPTDTNQASEVAEQIIQDIRKWHDGQWDYNGDDPRQKGTKTIQELIRTEKLKLLAEVRERVIGEDFDIPAEMEKAGRDFQKLSAISKTGGLLNKFKADLRTELAKLEAEL